MGTASNEFIITGGNVHESKVTYKLVELLLQSQFVVAEKATIVSN